MKKILIALLLLVMARAANAQTIAEIAPDVVGAEDFRTIAFSRGHWITSISKMVTFLHPGGNNATSIRAYNPANDTRSLLWPTDTLGIEGRDNYASFYVPALDQMWVWHGSHIETVPAPGARWAGRFCFATNTWCGRSAPALSSNPARNDDAFTGVVDLSATGGLSFTLIDPAMAWASTVNKGLMLGGSGDDGLTHVIFEPKPGVTEPYKTRFLTGSRPPLRSQCMNCMVSDGTDFYLSGGFFQNPGDPTWRWRRDLWKFTTSTEVWSPLAPPPDMDNASAMTYDSDTNSLVLSTVGKIFVYNLTTGGPWTNQTPPGAPCIFNHVAVYAPAPFKKHLYEGGNTCASPQGSNFGAWAISLQATASGGLSLPTRTWVYRPFTTHNAPAANIDGTGGGSKHLRFAQNPLTGLIHELGGDWSSSPDQSDQTQWTIDLVTDTWTQEISPGNASFPACGNQGEVYPGGPDEVGWVWDSARSKFWVLPGFYFMSQGESHRCTTAQIHWTVGSPVVYAGHWAVNVIKNATTGFIYTEGTHYSVASTPANSITVTNISIPAGTDVILNLAPNGFGKRLLKVLTYDPATKLWTVVPNTGEEFGGRFAIYDAASDRIRRVASGNDLNFVAYDPGNNMRTGVAKTCAVAYPGLQDTTGPCGGTGLHTYVGSLVPDSDYYAWDPVDRRIYVFDPKTYKAFYYNVDTELLQQIAPIPEPNAGRIQLARDGIFGFGDFMMPVFDTVNHVLMYPYVDRLGYDPSDGNSIYGSKPVLLIYHPDTDTWETDNMFQPEGRPVRANSFFFDPIHNALLAIGGLTVNGDLDGSVTGYFLYRYAAPTNIIVTLGVTSTQASTAITCSPNDIDSHGDGTAPFTRRFDSATQTAVTCIAPATVGAGTFSDWTGCDLADGTGNRTCHSTMTANKNIRANYTVVSANRTLRIDSSNPSVGINMTLSPAAIGGISSCVTPCTNLTYPDGQAVTVTAALTSGSSSYGIFRDCNTLGSSAPTCGLTMSADKTITATYISGSTYQPSVDFSNVQGQRGWTYRRPNGTLFAFANGRWAGPESSQLVMPGGVVHPGITEATVMRWTSPIASAITIVGRVFDGDPGGGDGVDVTIVKNGATTLFSATIANGDVTGMPYNISTQAAIGDTFDFIVAPRAGGNSNDTTSLDPLITPAGTTVIFGAGSNVSYGPSITFGK